MKKKIYKYKIKYEKKIFKKKNFCEKKLIKKRDTKKNTAATSSSTVLFRLNFIHQLKLVDLIHFRYS